MNLGSWVTRAEEASFGQTCKSRLRQTCQCFSSIKRILKSVFSEVNIAYDLAKALRTRQMYMNAHEESEVLRATISSAH